jgi:adenosylmethionine-8-amino-7-oxononanoate aminotransferase
VGAGRTGSWWAIEQFGVAPDIMVLGKGITGGYAPLSAVASSRRVIEPIAKGSGALLHAQTFSHHPVLAAAGLAAVRHVERHGLVERCRRMGALMHARLEALRELPHVGDVRGRGLLAGVEFVAEKATRAPFPRRLRFAEAFAEAALRAGLMTWTNVGQANGVDGDLCCLAPPFVIGEAEIHELTNRFTVALNQAVERVRHA